MRSSSLRRRRSAFSPRSVGSARCAAWETGLTMPDESTLAIIVVNYGSSALLERNLVATARGLPDAAVYVVDNRTTAEEARFVGELAESEGWFSLLQTENL